ncbi:VanZ family protein [Alkalihalobacillus alcalophilus ATCC 27647 = CGMCC 1.3604]|uniref:VanZ family protein n=1 Tax=Alkalihalobacillus alcalophilus ATCC 27647 = CGMCC 1.3604 TaxID=1218173 RepID=A0A094WHL6_ALKAL|nr:VanZ family protein [Alkalihalobacillus alcalophilus]KGA97269.1 VanZ family protein [Alkalihalobacillus alcalophilus ATCC 27647 = CGMCC 1.3604]MED1562790.1 VanZ family protein [Alkalihalobacillus alcalophilus]THG91524.1 VanZ family protein [Alkalihalobacillus alcalophilus ATCC 27647 = CGMCC 1.3604]
MRSISGMRLLFYIYIIALIYLTLFAWNYGASLGEAGPGGRNYNLIPFRSIYRISVFSHSVIDPFKILIGNIILFIPFGYLLPYLLKSKKGFILITLYGFLTSMTIELLQFTFLYRVADVDDLILNTLGACIGFGMYQCHRWMKRRIIFLKVKKH